MIRKLLCSAIILFFTTQSILFAQNKTGIGGTISTNTFVVATDGTAELTWASAAVSGVSLKLLATEYLSIPVLGSIGDSQRQTAYRFECVALA